jgi:hypothetical protein
MNESHKTDIYKKSVINMGTKLYNKLSGYIKEMDNYKSFKKELQSFLLYHAFCSVEESVFFTLYYLIFHLASKYAYFIKKIVFPLWYFVES